MTTTKNSERGWDKAQVKSFVRAAKESVGPAWAMFGPELREALVAKQFTSVITGQAMETLKTAHVENLWFDMLVEAGLT